MIGRLAISTIALGAIVREWAKSLGLTPGQDYGLPHLLIAINRHDSNRSIPAIPALTPAGR
jgi:hypothetical protein